MNSIVIIVTVQAMSRGTNALSAQKIMKNVIKTIISFSITPIMVLVALSLCGVLGQTMQNISQTILFILMFLIMGFVFKDRIFTS